MSGTVSKHFVEFYSPGTMFFDFYSPGTMFSEVTEKPIDSWDVEKAKEMALGITERHGATPHSFRFTTRSRGTKDLDSKETKKSCLYHLGGKIYTLPQVESRNARDEEILRSNMRCNGIKSIVVNTNSWKSVLPFGDGDVMLDFKPNPKPRLNQREV